MGKSNPIAQRVSKEDKRLLLTLDGQRCVNLNITATATEPRTVLIQERGDAFRSQLLCSAPRTDGGGEQAKWTSARLISRKRLPVSGLLLSCFSAQQQRPETRGENILRGCALSLPILLRHNDQPAMPNVDQEPERERERERGEHNAAGQKEFWVTQCQ